MTRFFTLFDIYFKHAYYESLLGTSMAAPFVSGVAGMVWAAKPQVICLQSNIQILCKKFIMNLDFI
jgi:subtilisin family serine protease